MPMQDSDVDERNRKVADNIREVLAANAEALKLQARTGKTPWINPAPMARMSAWYNMMRNGDKGSPVLGDIGEAFDAAKETVDKARSTGVPVDPQALYTYGSASRYVPKQEQRSIWQNMAVPKD